MPEIENEKTLLRFIEWTKIKIRIHIAERLIYFDERDIWWASLGVNIGHEQDGKNERFERPVVIIKKFNRHLFWALPFTSTIKPASAYYYTFDHDGKQESVILTQLRILSDRRLLRKIGRFPKMDFIEVKQRLCDFLQYKTAPPSPKGEAGPRSPRN